MVWMPFICLLIGITIGLNRMAIRVEKYVDLTINIGLIVLMLVVGAKIGNNDFLIDNIGRFGLQCLAVALLAIAGSVLATFILEKTILPLHELQQNLLKRNISLSQAVDVQRKEQEGLSPLVFIMPACIVAGVVLGYYLLHNIDVAAQLDLLLVISLVILYIGVGINFGINSAVFRFIKVLSWRVLWLPLAIAAGSVGGGFAAAMLLGLPLRAALGAASGMSYYSITGAMLTQAYGIEIGAYGFIVNVAREFFTVLLLPILVRISVGSTIASGAAGNMDTMLVPVSKTIGMELGFVALITGVILTFAVPLLLPIVISIM